jgi:unsaturated rhamnogalacturonyl hydrolase
MKRFAIFSISTLLAASPAFADLTVKATNKLPFDRPSQTIEIDAKDLASLQVKSLDMVHVKDDAGKELMAQAVDTDFDERHAPNIVIFQADFKPNESKTFTLSAGKKQVYAAEDFKAFGRFNRERFDDYQWENDRVAHRTYGKALQTWKGEPLTSSSIDIWSKRTPKMVTDRWYMHADYHADHGEGADFYSAGPTAGCGAAGVWAGNKVVFPANYVNSRTLAAGPIRVLFELDYDAFDAGGAKIAAVRRTQLDAGQNLNKITMTYKPVGSYGGAFLAAIGLKKAKSEHGKDFNKEHGWLTKFEDVEKNAGKQGLAIIVDDPKLIEQQVEDEKQLLLVLNAPQNSVAYRTGFFWDKANQFQDYEAWKKYVDEEAQGAASPIEVSVSK